MKECGEHCNSLWDYTVSTVILAKSIPTDAQNNPIDIEPKETVCLGRTLDNF